MSLDELEANRDRIVKEMSANEEAVNALRGKTKVTCSPNFGFLGGCGSKFFIRSLDYIQTHWYEIPHGSSGDQWIEGRGEFQCPCCGHRNTFKDTPEIEELKSLFAQVIDEFKE